MEVLRRTIGSAIFWLLAASLLAGFALAREAWLNSPAGMERSVEGIQQRFQAADAQLAESLGNAAVLKCLTEAGGRCAFAEGLQDQDGIVLLYRGDSLFWWSDNQVLPDLQQLRDTASSPLVKLANGYYVIRRKDYGYLLALGLLPVRADYALENRYLQPRFASYLRVPRQSRLLPVDGPGRSIRDAQGKVVFQLELAQGKVHNSAAWGLPLITLLAFAIGWYRLAAGLAMSKRAGLGLLLLLVGLGLLRTLLVETGYPPGWQTAILFQPHWFASPGLASSLGSLLRDTLILLLIGVFVWRHPASLAITRVVPSPIRAFLAGVGLFGVVSVYQWTTHRLVLDSNLQFAIDQVLRLDPVGLSGLVTLSFALATALLLGFALAREGHSTRTWCLLGILGGAGLTAVWINPGEPLQTWVGLMAAFIFTGLAWTWGRQPAQAVRLILIAALCAVFTGGLLQRAQQVREHDASRRYAAELAQENDPVMEFLFQDAVRGIRQDPYVKGLFHNPQQGFEVVEEQINTQHLGSYFDRYRIQSYSYNTTGVLLGGIEGPKQERLDSLVEAAGKPTATVGLYHISASPRAFYLARIAVPYAAGESGALYLRLERRAVSKNSIYPELLLRDNSRAYLQGYDWAVYRHGRLVESEGDFAFDLRLPLPWRGKAEYDEVITGDRYVLLHRPRSDDTVVLSRARDSWTAPVSQSSYLFLFFLAMATLVALPMGLLNHWLYGSSRAKQSLRGRIQSLVLLLIVFSFLVVGTVTVFHFTQQYRDYHRSRLLRKLGAVVTEVEYEARRDGGGEAYRGDAPDWPFDLGVRANLAALGEIHAIDLNLFDTAGNLLASSQPEIFGKGLLARIMEPRAWEALHDRRVSQWVQNERIGNLDYLSAYVPLRADDGRPAAYLHMPYFAQEENLRSDIAGFLVALVNVYLLLLVGAGLVALVISNSITQPLARVGAAFRRVQLGRRNEPIAWESQDEIGMLVAEYNKMLAELEHSAQLLARSERESAWREMAKQVAHEIKNPLTPMRLSVQHLLRAIKAGDPDVEELSQRVNRTLLEQIDTLSHIATEFSNFAKMPRPEPAVVDLRAILQSVADLFAGNGEDDGTETNVQLEAAEPAIVWADGKQLLRVFNNLVKNALQAIPDERKGHVRVVLMRQSNGFAVRVEDNGSGIAAHQRDSVFVPNFTTKGSGMGLGLAMSKNIIESAGGHIGFETEEGIGTTFTVWLPAYHATPSAEA